jgi:cation transport ATPase
MALTVVGASKTRTSDIERIELDLQGLACGARARRGENTLNKIRGVRASVDFGRRFAAVEAARDVSISDLCDAVRDAGYGAKQRLGTAADGDDPVFHRPPGLMRTVMTHFAFFARWLISLLHR